MKNAFICNSVPSCDIFLHAHAEKSNPTVFCLSGFFFFSRLFPFSAVFVFLLQLLSVYWAFSQFKNFFKNASSGNSYQVVKRGNYPPSFSLEFLIVSVGTYLKANLSVWVLLFGFSSSRSSFIIIRGALFM